MRERGEVVADGLHHVLVQRLGGGSLLGANMLRRFIPHNQGPIVMAACEQGELSYEDPAFGHGLFTYAILEALPPFRRASTAGGTLTTDGFVHLRPRAEVIANPRRRVGLTKPRQSTQSGITKTFHGAGMR